MLPARADTKPSLADVFPSCLAALSGEGNRLGLGVATSAVVVLVDGLGQRALTQWIGHTRTLRGATSTVLDSGFPTTTASALATLTTGTLPGQHGMVGYAVFDEGTGKVVNQLSGLPSGDWQLQPTVFERAVAGGLRARVIAAERYRGTTFTDGVLRGAEFVPGASIQDRMDAAAAALSHPGTAQLVYVYVPELDQAAHAHGWESAQWTAALEKLDAALGTLQTALGPHDGLLVTGDHGMADITPFNHVLFDTVPALMDGVAHVGGEPRCLQLYFSPDASEETRDATIAAWRASEEKRSWVATTQEVIEAGWFGEVLPAVLPRLGDLFIAARKSVAYYASDAPSGARGMVGQHGSLTQDELRVPLIRFGAFA
jgi:hypothetical protein